MDKLIVVLATLALLAGSALAATIEPGELRSVFGTVTAVSVPDNAVLVSVETDKGPLVVGVTMEEKAEVLFDGKPAFLKDFHAGVNAGLSYKREGDRLLGTKLWANSK